MNKQELKDIVAGDGSISASGTYSTKDNAFVGVSEIDYRIDKRDDTVILTIDAQWFTAGGIKELRKFLKQVQVELETP